MKKKLWLVLALSVCSLALIACGVSNEAGTTDTGSNSSVGSVVDSAHEHKMSKIKAVEPTCQRYGQKEGFVCTACQKYFLDEAGENEVTLDDIRLAKLPHEGTHYEATATSCGVAGNIEYYGCSMCNQYFEDEACTVVLTKADVFIPATAHLQLTHKEAVYGTGWNTGVAEHWYCEVCEGYYADADGENRISQSETVLAAPYSIPDFLVEVPAGKDPVVLQLSDTQIIDAAQERYPDRLGSSSDAFWATDQVEERCYDYLTETINATKPDLIIITGDIIYGEFDDNGTALESFVAFMEGFKIPWAPIFGNHDNESKKGADWQCDQFENAKYCKFLQRELTGNGNYSVAIAQDGVITRVFYMLDSNACSAASAESLANGHTTTVVGFGNDQIEWYTEQITELKAVSPNTKISFAYHVQSSIFAKAYEKYGFNQNEKYQTINIDWLENKAEGDFGYIGRQLKGPWDGNYAVFNGMKALGADSIFVGHEHCNSASVVYGGVRFQFGQKSSEYDRYNRIAPDGTISSDALAKSVSMIGGTVIPLDANGEIVNPYIYLCGEKAKEYSQKPQSNPSEPALVVNGLQYGGINATGAQMYADGMVVAEAVKFDETTNAYQVTAHEQGKLYVNVGLLKGKTTFTFTVYLTKDSTAKLGGYGEFAIRVKPNASEPSLDGKANGYVDFNSSATNSALKLEFGKWQTFTVDITGLDATCTEFAFNIAKGNVMYLRDVTLS